jgi:hypothetical protein
VVGSAPDPTVLLGPTAQSATLPAEYAPDGSIIFQDPGFIYSTTAWEEVTISDNATSSISIADAPTAYETPSGTAEAVFNVTLSAASQDTITVNYMTQDGTAQAGTDYQAENGTLTFAPGQTSVTISVPIIGTELAQHNETFSVVLSNPTDSGGGTPTVSGSPATGTIDALFTDGTDVVDFNNLTSDQQAGIAAGADLYNGLGGDDVVTLPNVANYNESIGNGQTLGWDPSHRFSTSSLAGQTYTVDGGDGSYNIALGAGNDSVTINGNGTSNITAGSGADTVTINGDGDNAIIDGSGSLAIAVNGTGDNIVDGGAGPETIVINEAVSSDSATRTVSGALASDAQLDPIELDTFTDFTTDDTIDFANLPSLTTTAVYGNTGELDVYSGNQEIAELTFGSNAIAYSLVPIGDQKGGTEIEIDESTSAASDPVLPPGYSIDWGFIHTQEGNSYLQPYVPPFDNSGVTIATGVDLANGIIRMTDFAALFKNYKNNPNFTSLYGAINANSTGEKADTYLEKHGGSQLIPGTANEYQSNAISITSNQASQLTHASEVNTFNGLISAWSKSTLWGTNPVVPISELPSEAQTALYDVAYQYGPSNMPSKTPKFLSLMIAAAETVSPTMVNGDPRAWLKVAQELDFFGDGYVTRRQGEANLIYQIPGVSSLSQPPDLQVEPGTPTTSGTSYTIAAVDTTTEYAFDPSDNGVYAFAAAAGSPNFASIELPGESAADYLVSSYTGATWSTPQLAQPLHSSNIVGRRWYSAVQSNRFHVLCHLCLSGHLFRYCNDAVDNRIVASELLQR